MNTAANIVVFLTIIIAGGFMVWIFIETMYKK
jgi:hypothetical protein